MEDLWEASRRGNVAGIRRYVNAYGAAKLNEFDKKGLTPLFLAASEDKLDAVELLVSNGADVNLKSKVIIIIETLTGLIVNGICSHEFLGWLHGFNDCCI
jgi:ankyrin repeat protein